MLVHATDPVARSVAELQFTLGEGPSVDAAASGAPVLVGDLADRGNGKDARWPGLLDEILGLDVRAFFAFPIRVGEVSLGTLDLYRRRPGVFSSDQVDVAWSAVDAIGSDLLQSDPRTDGDGSYPLSVHRAAGMVMIQLGTSIDDALVRLRATAYLDAIPITQLALDVLEGRRRFAKEAT